MVVRDMMLLHLVVSSRLSCDHRKSWLIGGDPAGAGLVGENDVPWAAVGNVVAEVVAAQELLVRLFGSKNAVAVVAVAAVAAAVVAAAGTGLRAAGTGS